jgi:imidazolonepropionase-like amidohydrolase
MLKKRLLPALLLAAAAQTTQAQAPVPAPAQSGAVLILNATAHVGNGSVVNNSAIAFDKGKITMVADATTIRIDRTQFKQIYDASGKHVYPGFIAADSQLGLVEVEAVRATSDQAEIGDINPNARAIIAYNTDSEVTPTVRSNGVLMAQISPVGGTISGSSSVVQLDAWNWEDAAVRTDEGMHLNWPALRSWGGWETGNPEQKGNERYQKDVDAIEQFIKEAKAYAALAQPAAKNPRLEAMKKVVMAEQTLYIHTDAAKTIRAAVEFGKAHGLKVAIVGGSDAWQETRLLKENNIHVVLGRTQRLPSRDDEDVDQPFKTAKALQEAGVSFSFSDEGGWKQRNLAFEAGQAVGAGLPYEAAVQAITLATAKVLGIGDMYGSLEVGKSATLFISEGDALDMRTNNVTAAFINGRSIDLDNKQKRLYRKYSEKYQRKQ